VGGKGNGVGRSSGTGVGGGVGTGAVGQEPGPQIEQPARSGRTIAAAAPVAADGSAGGVGMDSPVPGAEATGLIQPALLQAQMQPQIPEQPATGGIQGTGLSSRPDRRRIAMRRDQLLQQRLEPIVLELQQGLALRPDAGPAPQSNGSIHR